MPELAQEARQRPDLTGDRVPETGDTTLREEWEGGWGQMSRKPTHCP